MKKQNSIKSLFEGLPAMVKLALIITLTVVVIIVVNRAIKRFKAKEEIRDTETEITLLQQSGLTPSFSQSEYNDLANKLYASMDGMGTWDNDLDAVFNQLANDLDFIRLKSSFGLRDGYTFQQWIDGDLSPSRKQQVNTVLQTKGIKYRI